MESFGPFEITREIASAHGAVVSRAKKEGGANDDFVVKVFSLERLVSDESGEVRSELDPLFKDIGGSFTNRINLQKQAAESSPLFAPILAAGHDSRGAWYVTNFYARSIEGMLDRFVALEAGDLHHIVLSLVRAALQLKKIAGRSHGNLKPSNIFISGAGKPRKSQVAVTDCLAGDAKDAATYELADLRAVGELIYQLVTRRKVDFSADWVIVPVESTKEWTGLFGKSTAGWLNVCNKLLDPTLSVEQYSLSKLEADLRRLKPAVPLVLVVLPVAAVVLLVGAVVLFFVWHSGNYGKLTVTTDPPGARVTITPYDQYGNPSTENAQTKTSPTAPAGHARPLQLSLPKGDYRLSAEYEADNGTLKSAAVRVSVAAGQPAHADLYLPYGTLVVLSEPASATVAFGNKTEHTPYTNLVVKPGDVSIRVELANYLPAMWSGKVMTNSVAVANQTLERIQAGRVNVAFDSDPPGATIRVDGGAPHTAPWITGLEDGRSYNITAELDGWTDESKQVRFALSDGVNRTNDFVFPHGILQVDDTGPPGAEIWVDGKFVDHTPKSISLPLAAHDVALKVPGYSNYMARVNFTEQKQVTHLISVALAPLAGFVRLVIDPPIPGIQIANRLTGKVLAETTARDLQPVLVLPPTNYDLVASQSQLGQAQAVTVSLTAGRTNQASFVFVYGAAMFSPVQPDDAQAAVEIPSANEVAKTGQPIIQRPGNYVYLVKAAGYQDVYVTNAVTARRTNALAVSLSRLIVPVRLISDPPGARFFTDAGTEPRFDGANYWLPWGPTKILARLGRLEPVVKSLDILWNKTNAIPAFDFKDYSIVVLTNLPDDVVVKEGAEELASQPGPERIAYDKPGAHVFDLYEGGFKVDQVSTNLPSRRRLALQSEVGGREFRNGIGMALVKVPNLFGPGKDGWVGKSEVSQAEFERVMGATADPSKYRGADMPVENITWQQAAEFCAKLTQMDPRHPPGSTPGKYWLPTLDQWKIFSAGTDLSGAVYGEPAPEPVGSKHKPNAFGLNDVLGNVREWLDRNDPKNKYYIGGGFRRGFGGSSALFTPGEFQFDQASDDLGLRVVWQRTD